MRLFMFFADTMPKSTVKIDGTDYVLAEFVKKDKCYKVIVHPEEVQVFADYWMENPSLAPRSAHIAVGSFAQDC